MSWRRRGMESFRSLIADEGDQASSNFSVISASEVGVTPDLPNFVSSRYHAYSMFKSGHCGGNDIKYTELTFILLKH